MRGRQLRLTDFSGGYNGRDDILDLPLEQSDNVLNLQPVGEGGSVIQRPGDVAETDFSGLGSLGNGSYPLFATSAGVVLVPTVLDDLVARDTVGISTTLLDTSTSGLGRYTFIEGPASGGQGPIYYIKPSAGSRVARYWTGSGAVGTWTASAGTLPVTAYHLLYAGNRAWAARLVGDESALYWSELGDPRNWPAANVVKFDPNDGEVITGIGTIAGNIVVFKETKAFLVYDLDTGANRPLGFGIGGDVDGGVVQETPLGLIFQSMQYGVMATDGISSKPIAEVLGLPRAAITGISFYDGSVFLAVGSTVFYEYDLQQKSWWRHNTVSGKSIVGLIGSMPSSTPFLYASGRDTSVDKLMVASTYVKATGTALAPQWVTPYIAMGSERQKRFTAMEFRGRGQVTFEGRRDYDVAPVTDIFTRGPTVVADSERLVLPTLGVARSLQVRVVGAGTTSADAVRMDELVFHSRERAD